MHKPMYDVLPQIAFLQRAILHPRIAQVIAADTIWENRGSLEVERNVEHLMEVCVCVCV